jgi:hypothetical protein
MEREGKVEEGEFINCTHCKNVDKYTRRRGRMKDTTYALNYCKRSKCKVYLSLELTKNYHAIYSENAEDNQLSRGDFVVLFFHC